MSSVVVVVVHLQDSHIIHSLPYLRVLWQLYYLGAAEEEEEDSRTWWVEREGGRKERCKVTGVIGKVRSAVPVFGSGVIGGTTTVKTDQVS